MLPGAAPVGAAPFLRGDGEGDDADAPDGSSRRRQHRRLRAGLRWLATRYPYTVGSLVVYVLTLGPPSVYLQSLAAAVGIVFLAYPTVQSTPWWLTS